VPNAQPFAREPQIFAPKAIMLRPSELIDTQMRKERALDSRGPNERLKWQRFNGGADVAGSPLLPLAERVNGDIHARSTSVANAHDPSRAFAIL
jgi:hypothetical protein